MVDSRAIHEWRRNRKRSIQALPVEVGGLIALCIILYLLNLFLAVPILLTAIMIGIAALMVVGDLFNIVYLGRKLRRATPPEIESPAPPSSPDKS